LHGIEIAGARFPGGVEPFDRLTPFDGSNPLDR
jgi:hypothetical protein